MRNFGITRGRLAPGVLGDQPPATRTDTQARDPSNLIHFPARSLQCEFEHIEKPESRFDALEFGARVFVIGCVCAVLFLFIVFGAVINAFA